MIVVAVSGLPKELRLKQQQTRISYKTLPQRPDSLHNCSKTYSLHVRLIVVADRTLSKNLLALRSIFHRGHTGWTAKE